MNSVWRQELSELLAVPQEPDTREQIRSRAVVYPGSGLESLQSRRRNALLNALSKAAEFERGRAPPALVEVPA